MRLDDTAITLKEFCAAVDTPAPIEVSGEIHARLHRAHQTVCDAAKNGAAIYGLTTALGGNLEHRLDPDEAAAIQQQFIAARDVGTGETLGLWESRAVLLARIIGLAQGYSGVSPDLFNHLCSCFAHGLAPVMPSLGSIGASDLVLNAAMARALLGQTEMWQDGIKVAGSEVLAQHNLTVPALVGKDGMCLLNHSACTVGLAADVLRQSEMLLNAAHHAALLSFVGYRANPAIFDARLAELRPASGQAEAADRFRQALTGMAFTPQRIQDALSFRTLAVIFGVAQKSFDALIHEWEIELNSTSDNPAVFAESSEILSTPNFDSRSLAHHLQSFSLALVPLASAAVQHIQKLMNPALSGLPKYLSPVGEASAGMVPLQKTAAALFAEIQYDSQAIIGQIAPVSDAVEDVAPLTLFAARKLERQLPHLRLLLGVETLAAAQAIDLALKQGEIQKLSGPAAALHQRLREGIPSLAEDRPMRHDIVQAADILLQNIEHLKNN